MATKRYFTLIPRLSKQAKFDAAKHLENSEVSTWTYQEKLPKQPIQPLEASGKKFKKALLALENHPKFGEHEINRLEKLWDKFEDNEGQEIDSLLRKIDSQQKESYVNPLWSAMYLSDRVPLLCNYNPAIAVLRTRFIIYRTDSQNSWVIIWVIWTWEFRVCRPWPKSKPKFITNWSSFSHAALCSKVSLYFTR